MKSSILQSIRFKVLAIALLCGNGYAFIQAQAIFSPSNPIQSAIEYCKSAPLDDIEGIWEFSEDETTILLKRDKSSRDRYDLILLQTPDCRFNPGDTIGNMKRSMDKRKFRMSLKVSVDKNLLSSSKECAGIFDSKEGTLKISPMKLKLSFRTLWFLPKFWRSLKIGLDRPAKELPVGVRRVYPDSNIDLPLYF